MGIKLHQRLGPKTSGSVMLVNALSKVRGSRRRKRARKRGVVADQRPIERENIHENRSPSPPANEPGSNVDRALCCYVLGGRNLPVAAPNAALSRVRWICSETFTA